MTAGDGERLVDLELPTVSRQWSPQALAERTPAVYGPGRLVEDQWSQRNVHSDSGAARREGLSAPVGAAPQLIAQVHRMMLTGFGAGWIAGGKISVKVIKPFYAEDFTTAKGRITGVSTERDHDGDGRTRADCEVWVERADGTKLVVGTASAMLGQSGGVIGRRG